MKAGRFLRLGFGFARLHPEAFLFSLLAFPPLYGFFTGGEDAALGLTRMASLFVPHYALLFLFRRQADLQKSREFFRLVVGPGSWASLALVYLLALHAIGWGEVLLLKGVAPFRGHLDWTGFLEFLWVAQLLLSLSPMPAWWAYPLFFGVFLAAFGAAYGTSIS